MTRELMNTLIIIERSSSSTNEYGERVSPIPINQKVRLELNRKTIKDELGNTIICEGFIYSCDLIVIDDVILYNDNRYTIFKINVPQDVYGNILFYKGYLI